MRQPLTLIDLLPQDQAELVSNFQGDGANLKQFENNFIYDLDQKDLRFHVFNEKDCRTETISFSKLALHEKARLEKLKNIVDEFSDDEGKNIMFIVKNESGFFLKYLEHNQHENEIGNQAKQLLERIVQINEGPIAMAMPEDLGDEPNPDIITKPRKLMQEMDLQYVQTGANKKNKFSFEITEEGTMVYMNILTEPTENPDFIRFKIPSQYLVKFYSDLSKDVKNGNTEYLFCSYLGVKFSKIEIKPESQKFKEIQENVASFGEIGEFLQKNFPLMLKKINSKQDSDIKPNSSIDKPYNGSKKGQNTFVL